MEVAGLALEHDLPLEEYHRAGREITNGNPEVHKGLDSRRDDVTLANPFGRPVRGWSEVSATLDPAAANYRDGEVVGFKNVSTASALTLPMPSRSRATAPGWVVHRHADPSPVRVRRSP
jgi:hypothetical protein